MKFIKTAFQRKKEKNWPRLYVAVDMHQTAITPTWSRLNEGAQLYPDAVEVLQQWTRREDICLILWSPLHDDALAAVVKLMDSHVIRFDYLNENPEIVTGELCKFDRKWYMDIGLDDKFGFDAEKDWTRIKDTLIEIGEWR